MLHSGDDASRSQCFVQTAQERVSVPSLCVCLCVKTNTTVAVEGVRFVLRERGSSLYNCLKEIG